MRKRPIAVIVTLLLAAAASADELTMRQTVNSDGHGGNGSTIEALQTEGMPATVIVLHGLGGNGQEWGYLFLPVSLLSLTYVKFVLPTAPSRYVTYLNETMPSWFDIQRLSEHDEISTDDMLASVERLNKIIEGEIKSGTKSERIFLMGFSQGGALALTTFLRSRRRLAGCMGVATWLPLRNAYPDAISSKIRGRKTLLIHVSYRAASTLRFRAVHAWGHARNNLASPISWCAFSARQRAFALGLFDCCSKKH